MHIEQNNRSCRNRVYFFKLFAKLVLFRSGGKYFSVNCVIKNNSFWDFVIFVISMWNDEKHDPEMFTIVRRVLCCYKGTGSSMDMKDSAAADTKYDGCDPGWGCPRFFG